MPRKYISTFWYHIGSNWYYRYDYKGNKVKAQLSRNEYNRRNKIIRGIKKAAKKPKVKPFDERAFQEPTQDGTLFIYDEDGEILDQEDIDDDDYYDTVKNKFNRYYDRMQAGELTYAVR